jgi:hypothetical protein
MASNLLFSVASVGDFLAWNLLAFEKMVVFCRHWWFLASSHVIPHFGMARTLLKQNI